MPRVRGNIAPGAGGPFDKLTIFETPALPGQTC